MKVHLVESGAKHNKYTYRTLYHLMGVFGVEQSDEGNADVILVSLDDPDDLPMLRRSRKIAGDRPLIAGGFECFCGEYLLAYADACNVGEGFEFFEAFGKAKRIEEIYELPFVLTKEKKSVYPSTRIDAQHLPLVRIGKRLWYYLSGRGCRAKCAFCLTSFSQPHWANDASKIKKALRHAERNKEKVTLISNDSGEIGIRSTARNVQSVRVVDYVKNSDKFKSAHFIHFGIEGFSEEHRRFFRKPIPDDVIFDLIRHLQERKKPEAEFFFIPGLPGTFDAMMKFAESVPVCAKTYPRIHIKLTTLNPMPHTPLWTLGIDDLELLTDEQVQEFRRTIKARNVGFRLFSMRSRSRELWRAAIRNCTPAETRKLGKDPGAKAPVDQFLSNLARKDLMHLLRYDGRPMPNSQIVTPWRKLRDKIAGDMGMAPVTYKSNG